MKVPAVLIKHCPFAGKSTLQYWYYPTFHVSSPNSKKCWNSHLGEFSLRGAGKAQRWERSPPTSVARVRFSDPASYVGWVCCWFSTLLREVFSFGCRFSPLLKNQHFQIPIWSWNAQAFQMSSCELLVLRGYTITFTFFKLRYYIDFNMLFKVYMTL